MNTRPINRLVCAAAALVTTLALFSGVAALGDPGGPPVQIVQAASAGVLQ